MSAREYLGKAKCVQDPKNPKGKMTLQDCTVLLFISEGEKWGSFTNKNTLFLQYRYVLGNGPISVHTLSQQCICKKNEFSAPVHCSYSCIVLQINKNAAILLIWMNALKAALMWNGNVRNHTNHTVSITYTMKTSIRKKLQHINSLDY